jgi:hypothetical protein
MSANVFDRCREPDVIRTPVLGRCLLPVPTGIREEMGLWPQNSHRTACENKADITHLILALVPSATPVARSQRSTSTVLTCSSGRLPPARDNTALCANYVRILCR